MLNILGNSGSEGGVFPMFCFVNFLSCIAGAEGMPW